MAFNELRDAVVQVKSESTPGTAETSGFTTIEINGSDSAGVTSPDLQFVEATILRPDFDQRPGTPGRAKTNVSIPSYATVKAAATSIAPAPANGILLKACGLSESVVGELATYTPTTTDQSMTVHSFNDGIKTISAGVRGGFSLDLSAGQYPTMTFTGEGDYANPSAAAVPTGLTYPDEVLHQVASASMVIGSASGLVIRNFSFNWDVSQTERLDINSANGYKGTAVTAKVGRISTTVEFVDGVSWNPEALLTAGATHAVNLEIGDYVAATSGSGIRFEAPAAQITGVSRTADSGVLAANIDMVCTGATPFNLIFKQADTDG